LRFFIDSILPVAL